MRVVIMLLVMILVASVLAQPPAPPPTPESAGGEEGNETEVNDTPENNETNATESEKIILPNLSPEEEDELVQTLQEYGVDVGGEAVREPNVEDPKAEGIGFLMYVLITIVILCVLGGGTFFMMQRWNTHQFDPVINYLRTNMQQGHSREELVQALRTSGWSDQDIEKCLKKL